MARSKNNTRRRFLQEKTVHGVVHMWCANIVAKLCLNMSLERFSNGRTLPPVGGDQLARAENTLKRAGVSTSAECRLCGRLPPGIKEVVPGARSRTVREIVAVMLIDGTC